MVQGGNESMLLVEVAQPRQMVVEYGIFYRDEPDVRHDPGKSTSFALSVASHRDTATSQTALLNPYDRPERDEAAETSAYPSGSKRLDAESTIYGKAPPEEKQKKVAILDSVDYHSRDCPWTGIQSCTFLVLPVLACVFAAAVLILTLLIAFGVLQGEQTAAEQVGGALNRLYRSFSCEWRAVTRRHPIACVMCGACSS